jgi:hypothetical protein
MTNIARPDIVHSPFAFEATEITFTAVEGRGLDLFAACFGAGARSAVIPKSHAASFLEFAARTCVVAETSAAN